MTDVQALIAAANQTIPEGWRLDALELRKHKYRSLWRVTALRNGVAMLRWDVYRVGAALPAILNILNLRESDEQVDVVVVADADGWVKSMEDQA